jgi:DNA-binding FadR family transcriptional regulator
LIGVRQLKALGETLETMKKIHRDASKGGAMDRDLAAAFDQADLRFHLTILEAADNRRMLKVVGDFHLLTGIIGAERHDYDPEVLEMTLEDHSAIYTGLKEREPEKVRRAMQTHIRNSRQLTLSLLSEGQPNLSFPTS